MYLLGKGGKSVFPFYEASHVRGRWRAPLLAEPDQTPHITMWHYGYGRLLRCGCAGSMRREGYGGCAGAVVLGYSRSAPLNTAVECSSSPQHRGSKATCRPPSPGGSEKNLVDPEGVDGNIHTNWLGEKSKSMVAPCTFPSPLTPRQGPEISVIGDLSHTHGEISMISRP